MIERQALVEMFDDIAERGQWNMAGSMLWGYFFTHDSADALHAAASALQARDYEFVSVWKSDPKDSDGEDLWWLHVQRVEVHTVDSLFARNEQLYEFAAANGLRSYDGMDVGPFEPDSRPA